LVFEGCKKFPHVESKIGNGVVIFYSVHGSYIHALLSRVRSNVDPNLFEEMEHVSASLVCGRRPFLGPGIPKEDLCKEVVMYAVSAEAMPRLVVLKLDSQICVPNMLPQLEGVEG